MFTEQYYSWLNDDGGKYTTPVLNDELWGSEMLLSCHVLHYKDFMWHLIRATILHIHVRLYFKISLFSAISRLLTDF